MFRNGGVGPAKNERISMSSPYPSEPIQAAPASGCARCKNDEPLGFEFVFAFQPIVDLDSRTIYAHEALVRGPQGESAYSVLAKVTDANRYRFDQACRVHAIEGAAALA